MSLLEISRFLSLILRHKPEVIGITLDEHGWANVNELIEGIAKQQPFDMETLVKIVDTDDKQRYSFNSDKTLIRANQGHSIPVDVELEEKEPPAVLYHGTGLKFKESIEKNGLIPKSRLYVHLSVDKETALKVGKRHGAPVIFIVHSSDMFEAGFKFYYSKNGVWLTKNVPVAYLSESINNEYTSLEEFKSQYVGVWGPSDGHWFGLDFKYNNQVYRFHTGTMYGTTDVVDDNGIVKQFGIYIKTDKKDPNHPDINLYSLLGEYSCVEDALESTVIEGIKFRDIIMDDSTEILGQD